MPVTVKGNSRRRARIKRTKARATLPYPISAIFKFRF
jgi:hypothetical protein